MAAENLTEAAQFLADNRGGRQRQSSTEQQRRCDGHAEYYQQTAQQDRATQHLQTAQTKHHLAQSEHFRQGKFQPQ
ncbi:hypothetical protein D3C76_1442220 [compost metagenome]